MPVAVQAATNLTSLSWTAESVRVGHTHTCALMVHAMMGADPVPFCWGAGDRGQLGTGDEVDQLSPVTAVSPATGLDVVATLYPGWDFTLAIDADGDVWHWGADDWPGWVGGTHAHHSFKPVKVVGLDTP